MLSPVKVWRNQKKIQSLIGKKGKILSWTIVRVPPTGFSDQAPYPVVIAKLENNTVITAQLVDLPAARLPAGQGRQVMNEKLDLFGMEVVTIIRRVRQPNTEGIIPYGIKVKLL